MMPLICPGCGGRMDLETEKDLVPFTCPYCAVSLAPQKNGQAVVLKLGPAQLKPQPVSSPVDVSGLVLKAQEEEDPVKRYAILQKAEEAAPRDLNVQKALLLHGRLHERSKRQLDYSVIKCYLLHAFEPSREHTTPQREKMILELFGEERLRKAMDMADDPNAFLKEYLTALSGEYIRLFLRGSNRYMNNVFGFSLGGKPSKMLAAPAGAMILRMFEEPALLPEQRTILAKAFYDAYELEFPGETAELDKALGEFKQRLYV
jgi:hypothetical protein